MSRAILRRVAALWLTCAAALLPAVPAPAEPDASFDGAGFTFHHPGLLNDLTEFATIRRKIAAHQQPWAGSFARLQAMSRLPYLPRPTADISQGFGGANDHGFDQEMRDANAAYDFALIWILTGNEAYAVACRNILDAWSASLRSHSGPNWYLETAWAGALWPLPAELLRATYGEKWPGARPFGRMLNDVFLPVLHGRLAFGNREFAVINALVAIGVYNDDPAAFAEGISHFKRYVPEYYYIAGDGEVPPVPDYWLHTPSDDDLLAMDKGRLPKAWTSWITRAQRDFNRQELRNLHQGDDSTALGKAFATGEVKPLWGASVGRYFAGYSPETGGRDLAHAESAFGSTINTAEIAHHQNIDLYGPYQDRLVAFMERSADLRLGAAPPEDAYGGNVKPGNGLSNVYETAYDHYHNVSKLPLDKTWRLIVSVIRNTPALPFLRGQAAGRLWAYPPPIPDLFAPVIWGPSGWITQWTTLTHGDLHVRS